MKSHMFRSATRFPLKRRFLRAFSTYYEILGVARKATKEEIRTAYLGKAKSLHPDVQPVEKKEEATNKFRELLEAYNTLADANERLKYDSHLDKGEAKASREHANEQYQEQRREQTRGRE